MMVARPKKKVSAFTVLLVLAAIGGLFYWVSKQKETQPAQYLALAAMLFAVGAFGVLVRRNALVIFMSIELMLNAVNLTLVSFARLKGNLDGQVLAFFVMVVAAAEVVVGLAILVSIFRKRTVASVDDERSLKW